MSRVVSRMTGRRPQPYATSGCMGMRSQGIHVTRFAANLQLVLDEGIMRTRLVRRRMMGRTLERTPTKWSARWS